MSGKPFLQSEHTETGEQTLVAVIHPVAYGPVQRYESIVLPVR